MRKARKNSLLAGSCLRFHLETHFGAQFSQLFFQNRNSTVSLGIIIFSQKGK